MRSLLSLFKSRLPRLEAGDSEPGLLDASEREPPCVGLALSSGGAKGLAHIGVIQVLEEHGIEVLEVAGTSIGAYVGAMWASGLNGGELEALAAEMKTSRDLLSLIDPALPPRRGFVRGKRIEKRMRHTLGKTTFSQLKKSLSVIATELDGYRRVVFDSGDVASAVRASLAIPGILEPANRDGIDYIDGGVSDPLPVDVLLDKPVDLVIAVSVIPALADLPEGGREPIDCIEQATPSLLRRSMVGLNRKLNYFAKGNLLDILRTAAFGSQLRLVEFSATQADVLIRPVCNDSRWHDYTAWRDYIAVGREAAEAAVPEILRKLQEAALLRSESPLHHDLPNRREI
jgi:NTE family protein